MIRRWETQPISPSSENPDSALNPLAYSFAAHVWDEITPEDIRRFFRMNQNGGSVGTGDGALSPTGALSALPFQDSGLLPGVVWQNTDGGVDASPEIQLVDLPYDVQGLEATLEEVIRVHGRNSIAAVRARRILGMAYMNTGNPNSAAVLFERNRRILRDLQGFGPDSIEYATDEGWLAEARIRQGMYAEAQILLRDQLRILGLEANRNEQSSINQRPFAVRALAVAEMGVELDRALRTNPPDSMEVALRHRNLAEALVAHGYTTLAEQHILQAIANIDRHVGRNHPEYARALAVVASLEQRRGRVDRAIIFLQHAVLILRDNNNNPGVNLNNEILRYEERIRALQGLVAPGG